MVSRRYGMSLLAVLIAPAIAAADTIYLKDGRRVEAAILKKDPQSVTVDWYGIPITYWQKDIERIEEGPRPETPRIIDPPSAEAPAAADPMSADDMALIGDLRSPASQQSMLTPERQSKLQEVILAAANNPHQQAGLAKGVLEVFADSPFGPERQAKLRAMVAEAAEHPRRLEAMSTADRDRLAAMKSQLGAPWLERITQAERAAAGQPGAWRTFVAQLSEAPQPQERMALVRRLSRAAGWADEMMDVATTFLATGEIVTQPRGMTREQFQEQLEKVRTLYETKYRQSVETDALRQGLFAYREVPEADLQEYVQFLESETGRWYTAFGHHALLEADREALQRFMHNLINYNADLEPLRQLLEPPASGERR